MLDHILFVDVVLVPPVDISHRFSCMKPITIFSFFLEVLKNCYDGVEIKNIK